MSYGWNRGGAGRSYGNYGGRASIQQWPRSREPVDDEDVPAYGMKKDEPAVPPSRVPHAPPTAPPPLARPQWPNSSYESRNKLDPHEKPKPPPSAPKAPAAPSPPPPPPRRPQWPNSSYDVDNNDDDEEDGGSGRCSSPPPLRQFGYPRGAPKHTPQQPPRQYNPRSNSGWKNSVASDEEEEQDDEGGVKVVAGAFVEKLNLGGGRPRHLPGGTSSDGDDKVVYVQDVHYHVENSKIERINFVGKKGAKGKHHKAAA